MDGCYSGELATSLGSILRSIGEREIISRIAFYFGFAQSVAKIDFNYVGFVDSSGRQKFSSTTPFGLWGLEKGGGSQLVQASVGRRTFNRIRLDHDLAYLGCGSWRKATR